MSSLRNLVVNTKHPFLGHPVSELKIAAIKDFHYPTNDFMCKHNIRLGVKFCIFRTNQNRRATQLLELENMINKHLFLEVWGGA